MVVPQLSEQAVLVSTLTDALPSLSLDLVDEWLPIVAGLVNRISDSSMQDHCKRHFWETLVGGEMDPERSQICVAWWTSRGGREMVLYGNDMLQKPEEEQFLMSGALPEEKTMAKL